MPNLYKVKDIAEVFNGKTPSIQEKRNSGSPILKIINVGSDGFFKSFDSYVDDSFYKRYASKRLRAGDTLILNAAHSASHVGSKIYYVEPQLDSVIATGEWLIIRGNEKVVNKRYLYYVLTSARFKQKISTLIKGIHLYPKDIMEINLQIPDMQKQITIVDKLDSVRRVLFMRSKSIKKLNKLTDSLFDSLFGDPTKGTNKTIGDNIDVIGGYAFKSSDYIDSGVPLIKIGNANRGYFDTSSFSFLSQNFTKLYEKWIVRPGDILITLTGTVGKDDYGNVALATNYSEIYLLNQRVAKIAVKNNTYDNVFLFHMFKHPCVKKELTKLSRGVRQANISMQDITNLRLIRPDFETQQKFSKAVNRIQTQLLLNEKSLLGTSYLSETISNVIFKEVTE